MAERIFVLSSVTALLFLFLPVSSTLGQVEVRPGVKAGANLSSFAGDDADTPSTVSSKVRTGVIAGAFLLIDVAGPLAIQPELLYVQKGEQAEGRTPTGFKGLVTSKVDYVELPVLLKVQVPITGPIVPIIFGGPSVALNVNASQTVTGAGSIVSQDFDDGVEPIEFGVHLGGGIDISTGVGILTFDIRYQRGITNIISENPGEIKNRGVGITGGLAF
jgi:hypothetical protein